MLAVDHIQPGRVAGFDDVGPARSARSQEEAGVAIAGGRLLAARLQPLQPELPDRLQHPEARLALRALLLPQQALVNQRGDPREDIERPIWIGDRLGRLQRAATGEDAEAAEEGLLVLGRAGRDSRRSYRAASAAVPAGRGLRPSAGASRCSSRLSSACGGSTLTQGRGQFNGQR